MKQSIVVLIFGLAISLTCTAEDFGSLFSAGESDAMARAMATAQADRQGANDDAADGIGACYADSQCGGLFGYMTYLVCIQGGGNSWKYSLEAPTCLTTVK